VIIDTSLFEYGFVKPKESEFLDLHQKAKLWLIAVLKKEDIEILMSAYQIAEVLEVFRRVGASHEAKESFIDMVNEEFIKRVISYETVMEAYMLSVRSNIHIYDYLVVLPFKEEVEEMYSADKHFQHSDFTSIANVINPLTGWITIEGKKPQKILNTSSISDLL
jgi:predicted nucleic acid-binding protein